MTDSPDFTDPYLDPDTGVVRNRLGAKTQQELDDAEADLVAQRQLELEVSPVTPSFDLHHLKAIHHHLFQDIYDWAGQERTVDISKGRTQFIPLTRFGNALPYVFGEIAHDSGLRSQNLDVFIDSAAHHLDAVNYLHPFREGNGRTQRIFFDQLAERVGVHIDWSAVSRQENIDASRKGEDGLRQMLSSIAQKTPSRSDAIKARITARAAELDWGDADPEAGYEH